MMCSDAFVNCFVVYSVYFSQRPEWLLLLEVKERKVRLCLPFKYSDFCKLLYKVMIILFKVWKGDLSVVYFKFRKSAQTGIGL